MIPKEEEEVKRAEQAAAELQISVTLVQKLRLAEFWYEQWQKSLETVVKSP